MAFCDACACVCLQILSTVAVFLSCEIGSAKVSWTTEMSPQLGSGVSSHSHPQPQPRSDLDSQRGSAALNLSPVYLSPSISAPHTPVPGLAHIDRRHNRTTSLYQSPNDDSGPGTSRYQHLQGIRLQIDSVNLITCTKGPALVFTVAHTWVSTVRFLALFSSALCSALIDL